MGSITSITFIPANTFCELVESITRWKSAKGKCKTFRLLHHRVIELTTPSTTIAPRPNLSSVGQCPIWRTIWIVDAHRDDGKRFIVHADEKLTVFVELERAIHESRSV